MAKFNVKWSSGKELTVEKSDCANVDEFINSYFGRNADPEAQGTEVTLVKDAELLKDKNPEKKLEKEPAKDAESKPEKEPEAAAKPDDTGPIEPKPVPKTTHKK